MPGSVTSSTLLRISPGYQYTSVLEGVQGGSFQEYLALFNPGSTIATVKMTYLFTSQSPKTFTHTLSSYSRATISVN